MHNYNMTEKFHYFILDVGFTRRPICSYKSHLLKLQTLKIPDVVINRMVNINVTYVHKGSVLQVDSYITKVFLTIFLFSLEVKKRFIQIFSHVTHVSYKRFPSVVAGLPNLYLVID